jgi:peptidase M1-like protein
VRRLVGLLRGAAVATAIGWATISAAGAAPAALARAPQIASYAIRATYDATAQTISGHEVLTWRNATPDAATHLYLHLYLNAFANSQSTFMREVGSAWSEWLRLHPDGWGYIEIQRMRIADTDVTARLQFVHPDDDNTEDRTVVRVPLDTPVRPRRTLEVEIDFVAKLPKLFARSGYAGPFAFVAQWFPKIGVFEGGAWNCHQYHRNSEFYADFGTYDVTLTVPRDQVVGATGVVLDEHDNADGSKTLHVHAEDVHDFAWTADPRFRVFERQVDGVMLRLLLQPNHSGQLERHVDAARAAVQFYRSWVGEYPYPQLTMVDPGAGGRRAGGMEYPNLITVGTTWWMPAEIRVPEVITIHEFGHQYWYGMVASNEFEEAWLDEGINSYVEGRIMDAAYGPGSYLDALGIQVSSLPAQRLQYLSAATHDPLTRPAWGFLDATSYQSISYAKTALALDTLAGQIGEERVRQGLRTYFERWRFKHPHGADFLDAMNAGAGEDLSWYFEQVVRGTGVLDYAVTRVDSDSIEGPAGYTLVDGHPGTVTPAATPTESAYRSEVVVERLGEVVMPVKLQIVFDDGTNATEEWDGRERWKRFEYRGNQRVDWAVVDPSRTMPLDANWLNNSRMREAGSGGVFRLASRWGFWFQSLVALLSGL